MLTDAGLGKTYTESLRPALVQRRSLGIRRLGLVVVTHIDRDHIGGVEQTLKLQNDHGLARRRQLVEMRVQEKLRVQQASPVHRA